MDDDRGMIPVSDASGAVGEPDRASSTGMEPDSWMATGRGIPAFYPRDPGHKPHRPASTSCRGTPIAFPLPFFLLVVVAAIAGALVALIAARIAPAAAADVVEEATEDVVRSRPWLRARLDPAAATGLALTAALLAIVTGGLIVGVLALLVRGNATLRSIDASVAAWGDHHATHLSTRLLWFVTDLGDWPVFPLIGILVLVVGLRRAPSRYLVPFLLVVWGGNELATNGIKDLVDRARPTLNPVAATLGPSFPSGHSSTAASFYAALALVLSRGCGSRARAALIGLAAAIAVAVAASRVLLDVHWLSDVIAGLALGWAWFAVCAIAFGGRLLRFGAVAPRAGQSGTVAPRGDAHPRSAPSLHG
jgi:membrane-associated phospholipid phosphatase